jgi:hypothetical protein
MALCDECFEDFVHPLTHEAIEKNKRFQVRYGRHARWDWDPESSTLTFSDPVNSTLRIDVSVVGTTEGDSWEWSWANRNIEAHEKLGMEKVREFGESKGYEQLTTAFLESDEYTGWGMTVVAAHVLEALGTYRFPTDDGHCYLIYRAIEEIPKSSEALWGVMEGTVTIAPGVDLTEPTGEVWDAETGGGKFKALFEKS